MPPPIMIISRGSRNRPVPSSSATRLRLNCDRTRWVSRVIPQSLNLDVLDSQRSLFQAELTLAQARNDEYQSLVQLYKALGGGWK